MIGFPPKAPDVHAQVDYLGRRIAREHPEADAETLRISEDAVRTLLTSEGYRAWVEVGCPGPGDPISPASADALRAAGALDVRRKIEAARLRAAGEEWRRRLPRG